ncbi:MAG: hypothetical protein ACR2K4_01800 [Candidatus Limnocylindria bacterium]
MTDPTPSTPAEPARDERPFPMEAAGRSLAASPRPAGTSPFAHSAPAPDATPAVDDEPAWPGAAPRSTPPTAVVGRLTRIRASEIWADGQAMATWLAANGAAIAEVLGVASVTLEATDANIALGSVAEGGPVCVVCEVGASTDEKLGVLLRIAAVQDGGTVVWIAGDPGDTHAAALSWLNRSTSPRFHLVRVAAARIDGSASAPLFDMVVRPPRAGDVGHAPAGDLDGPRRRVEDYVSEG